MSMRVVCLAILSLSVMSLDASSQGAPSTAAEDPLWMVAVYNGRWHSEDESFDTKFSKASKETVEITNTCSASGEFYVCHQQVSKPSGPGSATVIFLWNVKERLFDTYVIDSGGGDAYHGHLTVHGSDYTWAAAKPDPSRPNQWRTLNTFSGPDHIVYQVQFSSDGKRWTTTRQGNESRVGK
jgi:hypothetical protein